MNDGLDDAITVVVYETQRATLVGDGQSKLVVIDEADLHSHTPTQHEKT